MREILLDRAEAAGEGRRLCCRYYLLERALETGGFRCASYGVAVENAETGERARREDLTLSRARARALLALLARNTVTPAGLDDVLADWLQNPAEKEFAP